MPGYEVVSTPNPNSLKFTARGFRFLDVGMVTASSVEEAQDTPLARVVCAIEGVFNVFILPEFMTVTKRADIPWDTILPEVEDAIRQIHGLTDLSEK